MKSIEANRRPGLEASGARRGGLPSGMALAPAFRLFSAILQARRNLRVRAADGLGRTGARVLPVVVG